MFATVADTSTTGAEPSTTAQRFRLRRTGHKVALTAHVLASVGWFGVAMLVAFLLIAASATGDPTYSLALYRSVQTAIWLTVPLGLIAAATGVVLGLGTTWGLARHWWVVAKQFIAAAVVATDLVLVAPGVQDAIDGHLSRPLIDPAIAHCVVLAAATILSVWKPRGRTPLGRRRLPSR
jgi:hypothetical protein